jgi:hypothetical protein
MPETIPATSHQPPATASLAKAVADHIDERLEGQPARFSDKPLPGRKIRQIYRLEKMGWPAAPLDAESAAFALKVADDLAGQLLTAINRNPGCELVSWAGEIPRSIAEADFHNGKTTSVRVLGNHDIHENCFLVRFDVIYRMVKLPPKKV